MTRHADRKILLKVADGPESIEIYTSEEGAVVDGAADCPALYAEIYCGMNCVALLGPFGLSKNLIAQLDCILGI